MTIDRFNSILTLLTNIGVIVGLVAVVYELNQNTLSAVGDTQQSVLELVHERESWLQDKEFAQLVYEADVLDQPLEGIAAYRYLTWLAGKINICEHVFERHREGVLSDYYWEPWDTSCKALLNSKQGRGTWAKIRLFYAQEFREYLDDWKWS